MHLPAGHPERIGPYRISGRLGEGGMGWVYLGRSPSGRAVAVKVVRPEYANDRDFRERFAREVTAARSVSGAFTAAVIDADPAADPPWLATVYVPGPSLWEAVAQHGPLPERQVRLLGAGLAEALQAIHGARLVHRDLKPGNVLLAEDGPRVIDFGISRRDGYHTITRPGMIMGTPSYMSPEQIKGESATTASDVFALGAVLGYAATGRAPFGDTGLQAVMLRVLRKDPDLPGLSDGLREPLLRCTAKDPAERPELDELLTMLIDPLDDEDAEPWPWRPAAGVRPEEALPGTRSDAHEHRPLLRHARALLDAGLNDRIVVEAVTRGRR